MTELKIGDKVIPMHWGALVAEWLWVDTVGGEVTSARSDWGPVALFYAHKNWQRCDPDSRKMMATKGDFYQWFDTATDEQVVEVFAEYEESRAKERWDKLVKDVEGVVAEQQKKIHGATLEGTATELSDLSPGNTQG